MGLWILAGIVVVAMLAIVLVALFHGRTDEVQRPAVPDWSLPTPRDLAEPRFPLAWHGYDPDHVDAWVEGIRRAQEELWTALGPSGVAELHERIAAARERQAPPESGAASTALPPSMAPPRPARDEDTEDAWEGPAPSDPGDAPLFLRPADAPPAPPAPSAPTASPPAPRPTPSAPAAPRPTPPPAPPSTPADAPLTDDAIREALREPPPAPEQDGMPEIKPKIRADDDRE